MTQLLPPSGGPKPNSDRTEITLRNKLLRRAAAITVGGGPVPAATFDLTSPPKEHEHSPWLHWTLNGHAAWIQLPWGWLQKLTQTGLESLSATDAALLIEASAAQWLDPWEQQSGCEIRCLELQEQKPAPQTDQPAIAVGLTVKTGTWTQVALMRLTPGASAALGQLRPLAPRGWSALEAFLLSAKLELTGPNLRLSDLYSLQLGDALVLPPSLGPERLVLENQLSAPARFDASGTVTLTAPFQPRNFTPGEPNVSDETQSLPTAAAPAQDLNPNSDPAPRDLPLDRIGAIEVRLSFRLGEALVPVNALREMGPGTTIALDQPDGDMVDIAVNGQTIGTGELITVAGQRAVEIRKLFSDG